MTTSSPTTTIGLSSLSHSSSSISTSIEGRHIEPNTSGTSTTDSNMIDTSISIEYSRIFHRYIVYQNILPTRNVVESYLFLDDATAKYPQARIIVQPQTQLFIPELAPVTNSSIHVSSGIAYHVAVPVVDVQHETNDVLCSTNTSTTTTKTEGTYSTGISVYDIFQTLLNWKSTDVDQYIFQQYPKSLLKQWNDPLQLQQLQERIRFLLSPVPPPDILYQINITDNIDWPHLFYNQQYGAGLSIQQVTVALQQLPDPYLLFRDTFDMPDPVNDDDNYRQRQQLAVLYEQTPPAVVKMTMSTLHLWVTGVSQSSIIALAYLHWRGWDWSNCRIVLHAFRTSLLCNTEPSWQDHYRTSSSSFSTCATLKIEALSYLQSQLQIRPWHIRAMLQTHSRLSMCTPQKIQQNVRLLQESGQFRSYELQQILLQMPSLLGASTGSITSHFDFWIGRVGLLLPQLRQIAVQKPALLQYNITSNLEIKWNLFRNELQMDDISIRQMTMSYPQLWGRSLEKHYRPFVQIICTTCGNMTIIELGCILQQVPELMLYNYRTIQRKLEYLQNRLGLVGNELKDIVIAAPRILKESIDTSLRMKIETIETMTSDGTITTKNIIQNYPSLLTLSKAKLQQRLQRSMTHVSSEMTTVDALEESKKKRHTKKAVWLMSTHCENNNTMIELVFSDVTAAALHAETSVSNMYKVLRDGKEIFGRRYIYANDNMMNPNEEEMTPKQSRRHFPKSLDSPIKSSPSTSNVVDDVHTSHLCIHTAGRAFPPEDTVRGRKRSGGMALQIRNWSSTQWGTTCSHLWKGQRLRLLPDANTLIIGYPYTRPSRRRCSLYACREALRVAKEWVLQQNTSNVMITITCESNYALGLLQNSTRLYEWGSAPSLEELRFDGPGELYEASPDILHSVARIYYLMLVNNTVSTAVNRHKNVTINFVASDASDHSKRLRDGAKLAATLMYDTIR